MPVPANIRYDAHIISPGTDLNVTTSGTSVTATYGDYWGGTTQATCSITVSYSDIVNTVDERGRVTVSGHLNQVNLVRTLVNGQYTSYQRVKAWVNSSETFNQLIQSNSSGIYQLASARDFSVTLPPDSGAHTYTAFAIEFSNQHTTSISGPDHFYVGILITNPNDPDYRPGKVFGGDTWLSHDRTGGAANIIISANGSTEMRTVSGPNASGDPPEIYHSTSDLKNMRRIGNG